jgi:hypothetical protein
VIEGLDFAEQPVKVLPAVKPVIGDDGADPLCVADLDERIRVKHHQVRQLSNFDRSQ